MGPNGHAPLSGVTPPESPVSPLGLLSPMEVDSALLDAPQPSSPRGVVLAEDDLETDVAAMDGLYAPPWKTALFWLACLASGGLVWLAASWYPKLRASLSLTRCPLSMATVVLVTRVDGGFDLVKVTCDAGDSGGPEDGPAGGPRRLVEYRCVRYLYSSRAGAFAAVAAVPSGFRDQLLEAVAAVAEGPAVGGDAELRLARLAEAQAGRRRALRERHGANEMVLPVPSFMRMMRDEMFHSFYVFQYASVILWCIEEYYTYAIVIFVITMFSVAANTVNAHATRRRLADLAHYSCDVQVPAAAGPGRTTASVSSTTLVPGDLVWVSAGVLSCDVVLLRGEAIVDENMLTGEAVPVRKVPYQPASEGRDYTPDAHKACTLYGGTLVAQGRAAGEDPAPLGMVVRTRYGTAKGQLLRSMLFPRNPRTHFAHDALKFIALMLTMGLAMYIWAVAAQFRNGADGGEIVLNFLDLVTIAVPPGLPACLAIATAIAINRLRHRDIYVSSPDRIILAGQLDVICFDKTGTLTESGLDLKGVHPAAGAAFSDFISDPLEVPAELRLLLATCHGLAELKGQLMGDPLDQKLFQATGWVMQDGSSGAGTAAGGDGTATARKTASFTQVHPPGQPQRCFALLRRFEFSSERQRSAVVVRCPGTAPGPGTLLAVKGSPEMLRRLVDPASVPADFDKVLARYAREGLRVIALASRSLDELPESEVTGLSQDQLERGGGLQFGGFAVMVNPLRPDSAHVIQHLQSAALRTVMVTGDHARTAVSVAQQCGILPPARPVLLLEAAGDGGAESAGGYDGLAATLLSPDAAPRPVPMGDAMKMLAQGEVECAVTGRGMDALLLPPERERSPHQLALVLRAAGVWARMSPDNKRCLVELLGEGLSAGETGGAPLPGLGGHVAFCGDGANDVGALKAAHVGVSLCEAEASVAAPLTARGDSIACMPVVVAEGRCSLTTSVIIFKFIIVYAFGQLAAVNLMYSFGLLVGNYQYLIQDLLYTTVLAGVMGLTGPAAVLTPRRPAARLISPPIMLPVSAQLALTLLFQLLSLAVLARQPGYERFHDDTDGEVYSKAAAPENSVVFLISTAQFVIVALVFNRGPPHRQRLWHNRWLVLCISLQTLFLAYLIFGPGDAFAANFGGLVPLPFRTRTWIAGLCLLNLAAAYAAEYACRGLLLLLQHCACWRALTKGSAEGYARM